VNLVNPVLNVTTLDVQNLQFPVIWKTFTAAWSCPARADRAGADEVYGVYGIRRVRSPWQALHQWDQRLGLLELSLGGWRGS